MRRHPGLKPHYGLVLEFAEISAGIIYRSSLHVSLLYLNSPVPWCGIQGI